MLVLLIIIIILKNLDNIHFVKISLPIHWYRAFQNFDPIRLPGSVSEADVNANYGDFLNGVSTLVSLT